MLRISTNIRFIEITKKEVMPGKVNQVVCILGVSLASGAGNSLEGIV